MSDVWTLLRSRARTAAGAPIVTYVDAASGERIELSNASLENAAAKIANALRDEFDLDTGATVGLRLPVHWQRAAWCAGIWTAGCILVPESDDADLVVVGPAEAADVAGDVAVVSLHPFGLPITDPIPSNATDVTLAVRQQPDAYLFEPPSATTPALRAPDGDIDHAALLATAGDLGEAWGLAAGGRLLADDGVTGMGAWLAALAVPLACNAATVLVRGDGSAVAAQEGITARAR